MATELYFIHKTVGSSSLSHSDDIERRRVHRHVQLSRLQRKKVQAEPAIGQKQVLWRTKVAFRKMNHATDGKSRGATHRLVLARRGRPLAETVRCVDRTSQSTCVEEVEASGPQQRRPGRVNGPTNPALYRPPIQDNSTDPFHASAVRIEATYHRMLQYFIQVSHPRTWHSETKVRGCYTFQRSAFDIVAYCVESAMSMFTMLASMSSQMQYFEGLEIAHNTTLMIQKALVATRQYITKGNIDFRLVFGIHSLANAEFYRYNVRAARTHVHAVKVFVDQSGGLEALPQCLKEWFLAGDEFIAAEANEKPLWRASEVDPGPWPGTRAAVSADVTHCESPEWYDWMCLPESLRAIIADIKESEVLMLERTHVHLELPGTHLRSFGHWMHLRACAIRSRLISLDLDEPTLRAMKLALLAFCYMTNTVTGRRRTMQVIASRLRDVLLSTQSAWCNLHGDLWILTIGALASEGTTTLRCWFVRMLIARSENDRNSPKHDLTEAVLIQILRRVLYCEHVQLAMVRSLRTDIIKTCSE